jgi:ArsR family transcriptional regulator, arsenate/arsenite/antimonite-responsive transcriptional repressor
MDISLKGFTRTMKALSDASRVKILKMLQDRELCACEIQAALELAQPTVSKHLRVLEDAGLVQGRKQGMWVHYSLETQGSVYPETLLRLIRDWLKDDPEVRAIVASLPSIRRELCKKKDPGALLRTP